jgi:tRNA(Ile)-lysidine synthase TilS/MesJ
MSQKKLENLVQKIKKNLIFDTHDKKIIVACSGGPDSMVLLDLYVKDKYKGLLISSSHISIITSAPQQKEMRS